VDFERGCLVLEDSKTGESVRPLATAALILLDELPRHQDSPYVFPATSGEAHFQGTKKVWPKVTALAELPGVTPHTLRHTLGSAVVSTGETGVRQSRNISRLSGSWVAWLKSDLPR
jgi:integrase